MTTKPRRLTAADYDRIDAQPCDADYYFDLVPVGAKGLDDIYFNGDEMGQSSNAWFHIGRLVVEEWEMPESTKIAIRRKGVVVLWGTAGSALKCKQV